MIEHILFNNAEMLIGIIQVLRRQLVYNTMVNSLVTLCSSKDVQMMRERKMLWKEVSDNGVERIFDISFHPVDSIVIQFDHPIHSAVQVKLEILLNPDNPSQPDVKIEMLIEGYQPYINPSPILSYTLTQCLLLPPMLYMVIKHPDKLLGPSPLSQQASYPQQAAVTAPMYTSNMPRMQDHSQHAQHSSSSSSKSGHKRKMGGTLSVEEMEQKRLK